MKDKVKKRMDQFILETNTLFKEFLAAWIKRPARSGNGAQASAPKAGQIRPVQSNSHSTRKRRRICPVSGFSSTTKRQPPFQRTGGPVNSILLRNLPSTSKTSYSIFPSADFSGVLAKILPFSSAMIR